MTDEQVKEEIILQMTMRVAQLIYGPDHTDYGGGPSRFWNHLDEDRKRRCRNVVNVFLGGDGVAASVCENCA